MVAQKAAATATAAAAAALLLTTPAITSSNDLNLGYGAATVMQLLVATSSW